MAVTEQAAAIERARKAYADFDAANVDGVMAVIADDVLWHVGGTSKYADDYRGKDAVLQLFGKLMQDGVGQKHEIHDILASEGHVVVLANVTVTYNGRSIVTQCADIHHENEAGQTTEFWRLVTNQQEFDDLIGG